MAKDLELHLWGAHAPEGEIVLKDLAALATALQELATRIGRDVIKTPGPGRTKQFMEEFAQLRLRAVESGSTVLRFSKGPIDKLDVYLPDQEAAEARFWEIVEAIRADERPSWTSDLIAESAAKLVSALRDAAPRAVLSDSAQKIVEIETSRTRVETWTTIRVQTQTRMTAKGRLEKVDLRSHEFRVRDDVGHAVDLKQVEDDVAVAPLVGQWVLAAGDGVFASGRLVALANASVEVLADPARGLERADAPTLEELLGSAPGPDPDGGIDLNDEDFAAFIEAAST